MVKYRRLSDSGVLVKIGPIAFDEPVRLAPMAAVTNAPFRLVTRECGNPLVTSEEIDAKALCMGRHSAHTLRYFEEERPIAMQLLGNDPLILAEAVKKIEDLGADIVDLNMGCPVRKVIQKGQGAALMRDPEKAAEIFRAMRRAARIPFTIKIRGGWDETQLNAVEIARIAEAEEVDAVTVHPRTRSQLYTGRAPLEIIAAVVAAVKIPVTGNGDVRSRADAARMMAATGCQSVMVGRGAMGRPWIFDATFEGLAPEERRQYQIRVIRRHRELIMERMEERGRVLHLKKNLAWYVAGTSGAAAVRQKILRSHDCSEVWELFMNHWESLDKDIRGPGDQDTGMPGNRGNGDGENRSTVLSNRGNK